MEAERTRDSKPICIVIVEDHPAVRQGLALLLGPEGILICAEADGPAAALACVERHSPDLVLLGLPLGDADGLALLTDVSRRAVPCLVYSMSEDPRHVESAFAAGALGYVSKRETHGVLVHAICEVVARRRFISPRIQ